MAAGVPSPNGQVKEATIEGVRYIELGSDNWFLFTGGTVGAAVTKGNSHSSTLSGMKTKG